MSGLKKLSVLVAFIVVLFAGVTDAFSVTVNELRFKSGSLQRKARRISNDIQRDLSNAYANGGNQYNLYSSVIRAEDFEEEAGVYDDFLSDHQRANNIVLLKAYTERLNASFVRLDRALRSINYYPRSFEKCEDILDDINNLIFSSNSNQYVKSNPVAVGQTYGNSPQQAQKPSQIQPASTTAVMPLGVRTANGDKRIQWMVGSKVKSITVECLEGEAIVDTIFIDGEIRKAVARTLKSGDSFKHVSNGKNNIKRIVMPVRKVRGNFKVQCVIEK